jgi:hypothetical protein
VGRGGAALTRATTTKVRLQSQPAAGYLNWH